MRTLSLILLLVLLITFTIPVVANAQGFRTATGTVDVGDAVSGSTAPPATQQQQNSYNFTPLTNLPGINNVAGSDSLPTFFNNLYRLCIGAAAVIAILQIMRAGTKFMFNKGSVASNQEAKQLIMNSILGLLLVLSPAIVFGIINPDILRLSLDVSSLKPTPIRTTFPIIEQATQSAWSTGDRALCVAQYTNITTMNAGQQCDASKGLGPIRSSCCGPGTVCCGKPRNANTPSSQNSSGVPASISFLLLNGYNKELLSPAQVYQDDRQKYVTFRDACMAANRVPEAVPGAATRCPNQPANAEPGCVAARGNCVPPAR